MCCRNGAKPKDDLKRFSIGWNISQQTPYGDYPMRFTHFLGTTAAAAIVSLGMAGSAFADGHTKDIVDTAVEAGSFTTLVAAVQAAGLEDTLRGEGPFTVFAPTDEAFAALPEGTVESLLLPENLETLQAVLTYHVLPGKVMSADIAGQELSVATVEGSEVMVNATDGVMVDSANVVTADIETSNGVIHVIDAVILPPSAM